MTYFDPPHPGGAYTRTTWERPGRHVLEHGRGTVDGEQSESVYWLEEGMSREEDPAEGS